MRSNGCEERVGLFYGYEGRHERLRDVCTGFISSPPFLLIHLILLLPFTLAQSNVPI